MLSIPNSKLTTQIATELAIMSGNLYQEGVCMDAVHFAEWLNGELRERDWSQANLARRAGRPRQTISGYVNARVKSPDPNVLADIARAFGYPPEQVMRQAGVITTQDENPPGLAEWIHIFRIADEEERERLLDYARYIRDRR